MMRRPPAAPPSPLLDVLGALWTLDVPAVGMAWSGALAGFCLGDGTVATGRAEWNGAPKLSPCEGGTMLTPATLPQPPLTRLRVHKGACLAIGAQPGSARPGNTQPGGEFLTGGDDGVLARTTEEGVTTVIENYPGSWVDLVAAGNGGWSAAATGRKVRIWDSGASGTIVYNLDLPSSVSDLAFDASGKQLAIAHYHGVTIWTADAPARVLHTPGCPLSVAWSPDAAYVICGLQENALHGWRLSDGGDIEMGGYPGQPRSLQFSRDGRLLASSGSPRVVCWKFDPPGMGGLPMECGLANSRQPVSRVACHPHHPIIAAGYHNGAVLLCQPGTDDVLFVKGSTGGSVTALSWSVDGGRLAMATQGGEIGLVALPDVLFHFSTTKGATAGRTQPETAE